MIENEIIEEKKRELRNGFSVPVYVNFTTWKKRDGTVGKLLSHFSQQTFKPTKIICWLSAKEYHHKVPASVQECLDSHLLDEVRWVRGNTYCHKRWEAFRLHPDAYNIMIDDDLYYPEDYIETLLAFSLAYPHTAVCYYGKRCFYSHGNWSHETYVMEPSHYNELYSGLSCFAPGLLPDDVLRHGLRRAVCCPKCDDSWVKSWLVKWDIPVVGCREWYMNCYDFIEDTQQDGLWEGRNSQKQHGVINKYINLCNCFYYNGSIAEGERVWPDMEVERYHTSVLALLKAFIPLEVRHKIKHLFGKK